jgi:hypothetical protein
MPIKAGTTVAINLDPSSERAKPLKALIYDVMGKRLILSQTSPPVLPPPPRKPVYITYIARKGDSERRLGFSAVVSGLGDDYPLSSGTRVPTIIVEMEQEPEETSLRKGFRIRAPRNSGLSLAIRGKNYLIFDISLTGVNFIQSPLQPPFKPSESLECQLNIDGESYPLKAKVIRVSETAASRRIAAAFMNIGKEIQPVLSRKILLLERKELSR